MMRTLYDFKISMPVAKLSQTLRDNRQQHKEDYELACKQYKKEVIELMSQRLSDIKEGDVEIEGYTQFDIPCPVSYIHVYDKILRMLEATDVDSVELTSDQFSAWVEDQWEWSHNFHARTSSYAMKIKGDR